MLLPISIWIWFGFFFWFQDCTFLFYDLAALQTLPTKWVLFDDRQSCYIYWTDYNMFVWSYLPLLLLFFFFTDKLLIFTLLYYELIFLLVFHLLKSINFLKWKIVLSLTIFNCQWFSECAWLEELYFISIWVLIWFNMLLINIIYFKASHFTRVFFSLIHICAYVYARQLNVTLEWNSTWKSLTLLK